MEEIRPVLFIFCDNPDVKAAVIKLISEKTQTCVITSEFIRDNLSPEEEEILKSDGDSEEKTKLVKRKALDEELFQNYANATGQSKIDKRNASINRAFANSKNKLFIVDLENIPPDLLGQYAFMAKMWECKLLTLTISETQYHNGKNFILLKSTYFSTFAKLFLRSTSDAKIITNEEGTGGNIYIDMASAFHNQSPLIVMNSNSTNDEEFGHHAAYGNGNEYTILNITTGDIDVKNPSISINGRPLPIPKKPSERKNVYRGNEKIETENPAENEKASLPKPGNQKIIQLLEWAKSSLHYLFGERKIKN